MKTNIIKIGIISLLGLGTVSGVVLTKQVSTHVKEATAATNLTTYYQNADTSSPTALLNSLKKGGSVTTINTLGYGGLWDAYKTTDIRSDGKICDTYSNTTNYTPGTDQDSGSHSKEGDTYNREHTIPKSWWGGTEYNQGCDIFIVYPTDSYVNGMRSNYPYGEVGTISYASNNNYSLLGSSSRSGYTGTVFEPADEWKGDFARVYFYAIATYTTTSWTTYEGSLVFESSISSPNYGLTNYAKSLFLEWNSQDPVSQWERDRNDKGQAAQGNRNPFIDHPEWADFIWNGGSLTTKTLTSISKSGSPSKTTYTAGETFNPNGLTITATYSDGSTANVTNSLSWTPSPLTEDTTSVTGTYTYGDVSKTVTVTGLTVNAPAPKTLSSIAVSGQKTNYSVGDAFVKPVVTATYSDGSTENVTDSATFTGYDMSTIGTQTVTVSYGGKTTSYTITISAATTIGESTTIQFDTVSSDSGTLLTSETFLSFITSGSENVSGAANITKVYKGVRGLKFGSSSAGGSITINFKSAFTDVSNIKINCINYNGESSNFTVNGISVTVPNTLSSVSTNITGTVSSLTITSTKRFYINSITIECEEEEKVLSYISVPYPTTEYYVGDSFIEPTVKAHYTDGTTETVTGATFSGFNSSTTGTKTITVSYGGKTTTYQITVTEATTTILSITIDEDSLITDYDVGNTFVPPTIIAHLSNGLEDIVIGATFTGYDMSTPGTQIVTVTYRGFTLTYTITVSDPSAIHGKTINDPLTVTEAMAMAGNEESYYVRGLISKIDEAYSSTYHNTTFWITDDESNPKKFQLYRIYHETDPGIVLGYDVIVEGKIILYNSTTYEMTNASGGGIERLISIEDKADAYASAFNSANVCGTDNYTPAIASKWSEQRIAFQALDSYTKNYLKDVSIEDTTEAISECITRYERVLELHGEDAINFPDFMNRNVVNSSKVMNINNQDAVSMVVILSLVGTSFAFCFASYKRKKKYN